MSGSGTALLLLLAGVAAPENFARVEYAELSVRRSLIIRVPVAPPSPTKWKEKRGPKCLPMQAIGGAVVVGTDKVDLILRGGQRFRAKLGRRCPAIDYYSGFYIAPGADGRICADRDALHARSGGECQIAKFVSLVPDD